MQLWLYLTLINILTYGLYWLDKRAARRGDGRIPEVALLVVGFLGGTVAAFLAQRIVRHKNKKTTFQLAFWAVTVIQVWLLIYPPALLLKIVPRLFIF